MAKKRGNSEGTIYRRQNGTWSAQVSLQDHRLTHSFKTQHEAQEWLRKIRGQVSDGMSYASSQLTLSEHLDGWLTTKKVTRRYATWLHYNWLVRRYICPTIGNIKLKDLQANHIQSLYSQLLKSGTGIYSIRKIHFVLHYALNQAVKQEVIL
jgi:Phage integrase, N-terminal SAM-like domain